MAYTTNDIILWGKISQALSARGEAQKRALTNGAIDKDLHIKLYVERKTVEWYNRQATIDNNILYTISNWLFALEGVWGLQAQFLDGGSGGSVTPVSPSSTSRPEQLNFTVAASGTPFIDGQTSVTFSNFIGYNLVIDKDGQPMTQISTAPIYYTWNRVTGVLTLNQAAITGNEFQITPV